VRSDGRLICWSIWWAAGCRLAASGPARDRLRPALLAALLATGLTVSAKPQYDFGDQPLLASAVSDLDIEMRGRWVRQWRDPAGPLVLMFNGGFQLDMNQRRLSANNAVVWIEPAYEEQAGGKYYALTVYLAENAEVREPGGTITQDRVLLVRGLRTRGQIIKYHDAHAPENVEESPLYQQALRDRLALEAAEQVPAVAAPEVARPAEAPPGKPRPQRVIRYRLPNIEPAQTPTGERVFVSTGGVYFSQGGGPDSAMLEIRADNAVLFPVAGSEAELFGQGLEGERSRQPESRSPEPPEESRPQVGPEGVPAPGEAALGPIAPGEKGRVQAVYLEGDVVLSLGHRFVRAERLYYDFEHDRALLLDAVFRADVPARQIPLYVRAAEIRQLSAREFAADKAIVTTSEFYTPSYHVGADRVYVRDLTRRDAEGRSVGPIAGAYEMRNTTLNVEGLPLLWWPYSKGSLESSETLLRRISSGYSSKRGYELESAWYLFNLLGIQPPEGFDATLLLDYFSRRGPAVGANVDYARERYYGLLRSYFIYDQGEDTLGPLRRREEEPSTPTRGRALWRHRHYLPYDWELTLEASYASDPYFLEEYEKSEWFEGKEQETAIYLKRAKGVQALTFLANWRLLDFVTQTEHLPEAAYRRIGDTFLSPLVLYHESRIGEVRYLPDDRHHFQRRDFSNLSRTDLTFRADLRQEAELPLKLGPLNLVPFGSVRGSYWDGEALREGTMWRGLGVYGVRGGTSFSRVFDQINSELLDIHRIRHIIKPDYALWWANSNTRSELLTPFDYGIETIDPFYGATLGLRQVWQTKRGPEGQRRTVDLLMFNLEMGLFGNTDGRHEGSNGYANPLRPENSRARNYLAGDLTYRLSDTTSLLYDFNFDLNDRSFDRHDVSLAIERSPRLSYVLGSRYAGDIEMSLLGGGYNYKLTEKHLTGLRAWWDADSGQFGEVTFSYVRKLPRWYLGVNFEYDNLSDDLSISLSLWPEGIPEWTLGSRRFTGLGTSTGIRP